MLLLFDSNNIWDVGHFPTGNPRLVFPLRLLHGPLRRPLAFLRWC